MSKPSDEIRRLVECPGQRFHDLLYLPSKSICQQNRHTMSKSGRYKLNTIKDLGHCKKSKVAGKNDLSKSLARAAKRVDSTSQSLRSRETPDV